MDLKQILTAIAVAKHGSFSDAAEAVSFSQSAVSKQINSLEDELGIQIFERGFQRQPVTVTDAGSEIIEHFDKILDEYNEISRLIEANNSAQSKCIKIGSITAFGSFGDDILASNFINENPDVRFCQYTGRAQRIADALVNGEIDAMVAGTAETTLWPFKMFNDFCQSNKVSRIPVSECPLTIGVSLNHRLAKRKSIKISDLNGERILLKSKNEEGSFSPNRTDDLVEVLANEGVEAQYYNIADGSNKIRPRLAASGFGVMINMIPVVIPYSDLVFIPVEDYPYKATGYFLYKKNNTNPSLRRLVDCAMKLSFQNGFSDKEFRIL